MAAANSAPTVKQELNPPAAVERASTGSMAAAAGDSVQAQRITVLGRQGTVGEQDAQLPPPPPAAAAATAGTKAQRRASRAHPTHGCSSRSSSSSNNSADGSQYLGAGAPIVESASGPGDGESPAGGVLSSTDGSFAVPVRLRGEASVSLVSELRGFVRDCSGGSEGGLGEGLQIMQQQGKEEEEEQWWKGEEEGGGQQQEEEDGEQEREEERGIEQPGSNQQQQEEVEEQQLQGGNDTDGQQCRETAGELMGGTENHGQYEQQPHEQQQQKVEEEEEEKLLESTSVLVSSTAVLDVPPGLPRATLWRPGGAKQDGGKARDGSGASDNGSVAAAAGGAERVPHSRLEQQQQQQQFEDKEKQGGIGEYGKVTEGGRGRQRRPTAVAAGSVDKSGSSSGSSGSVSPRGLRRAKLHGLLTKQREQLRGLGIEDPLLRSRNSSSTGSSCSWQAGGRNSGRSGGKHIQHHRQDDGQKQKQQQREELRALGVVDPLLGSSSSSSGGAGAVAAGGITAATATGASGGAGYSFGLSSCAGNLHGDLGQRGVVRVGLGVPQVAGGLTGPAYGAGGSIREIQIPAGLGMGLIGGVRRGWGGADEFSKGLAEEESSLESMTYMTSTTGSGTGKERASASLQRAGEGSCDDSSGCEGM